MLHLVMQRATTTCNATDNMHRATGNVQHATETLFCVDNAEKTTDSVHLATCNKARERRRIRSASRRRSLFYSMALAQIRDRQGQATDSTQHATWDTGAGKGKQPTDNVQQTQSNGQRHARDNVHGTTGKRAADTTPHATRNRENATDDTQRATENGRQHAPCSGRHATLNKQRAACNRQHAPDFMKQQQTTGNGQHATDNVHQTADSGMHEDASTCEMQQEIHGTAIFSVRRAALASAACLRS
jgi:hypothetical protein